MGDQWISRAGSIKWTILGFSHGPKPSDWQLWWRYPGDQLVGIFWSLVEDPELAVPGSWIEDDESCWDRLKWVLRERYRWSGVKRRCVRRLRSELKRNMRNGTHDLDAARLLNELVDAIKLNAESWRHDGVKSCEVHDRLREIALCLGISRGDWSS